MNDAKYLVCYCDSGFPPIQLTFPTLPKVLKWMQDYIHEKEEYPPGLVIYEMNKLIDARTAFDD
jgi:hypothetical protein